MKCKICGKILATKHGRCYVTVGKRKVFSCLDDDCMAKFNEWIDSLPMDEYCNLMWPKKVRTK